MSRDHNLLKSISALFTEQTLKEIVLKATSDSTNENVEILSWEFGEASAKGDSYMSTVNKIVVNAKVGSKLVDVKLVVKSLPQNLGRRKTFRSTTLFKNEINFYREIVPRFETFLKCKGKSYLLCVPECYSCVLDGENDFIALHDVSTLGFGPITRQNCVNYETACCILQTIARFHGISFAYKDQLKDDFSTMIQYLPEIFFAKHLWDWYRPFHTTVLLRIANDALAKECPGSEIERRFHAYSNGELYMKNIELCSRQNEPTSVVSQGDCWAPNFLIRNISQNQQEVLMLDFQLARCSSPVLDLSFFIYSCTDKPLRDKYYDDMLKYYYNELCDTVTQLGSDPKKLYPWNTFLKEIKEQSVHGLTFALEAVPFTMLPDSAALDLDSLIKGDEAADMADVFSLPNIQIKENRIRLVDIIAHAVENNFI